MSAPKWDRRFMSLARLVSTWSKDPSTKVGAAIADPYNRVVSVGYNGLPAGIADVPELLEDRETKYATVIHAEENALLFASRPVVGCILYVYPFMPCSSCTSKIIQSGIAEVVSLANEDNERFERWAKAFALTEKMMAEANVRLRLWKESDL